MTGYGNPFRMILLTTLPPELTVYQHTHSKPIRIPSLTGVRSAAAIFQCGVAGVSGYVGRGQHSSTISYQQRRQRLTSGRALQNKSHTRTIARINNKRYKNTNFCSLWREHGLIKWPCLKWYILHVEFQNQTYTSLNVQSTK